MLSSCFNLNKFWKEFGGQKEQFFVLEQATVCTQPFMGLGNNTHLQKKFLLNLVIFQNF